MTRKIFEERSSARLLLLLLLLVLLLLLLVLPTETPPPVAELDEAGKTRVDTVDAALTVAAADDDNRAALFVGDLEFPEFPVSSFTDLDTEEDDEAADPVDAPAAAVAAISVLLALA